jgi:hypothetical protein
MPWLFSAYELMRTWRKRAEKMITWADNGGLKRLVPFAA